MEDSNKEDREFIEGVWRKVRYLEHLKEEEDRAMENQRLMYKKKLRTGIVFLVCTLAIVIPILVVDNFTLVSLTLSGIILLASGTLYEYIRDSIITGGSLNEY
jgi:hypothetical protein